MKKWAYDMTDYRASLFAKDSLRRIGGIISDNPRPSRQGATLSPGEASLLLHRGSHLPPHAGTGGARAAAANSTQNIENKGVVQTRRRLEAG